MNMKHKHLMRVRETLSFDGRSWTRMACAHKGCTHDKLVEHGWFQQLDRTWKRV